MRATLFCIALAVTGIAAGNARGGESDIMAMRGASDNGKPHVNYFQANWRPSREAKAGTASAGRIHAPEEKLGVLQWKNNCLQTPSAVFGRAYRVEWQNGFGQVAPYTARPAPAEGTKFMDLLVEELSSGG